MTIRRSRLTELRLRHDPLADLRHSGRAGGEGALSAHRGIHLRLWRWRLLATTIISALVPAIGVYQQIGLDPATLKNINPGAYLDQLRDLPPTRDGMLRHLDLLDLGGIVTFPSFHAASAMLYAWALWPLRWMRPIALLVNGTMLAATPLNGGHYFIDVIARRGDCGAGDRRGAVASGEIPHAFAAAKAASPCAAPMPAMVPRGSCGRVNSARARAPPRPARSAPRQDRPGS